MTIHGFKFSAKVAYNFRAAVYATKECAKFESERDVLGHFSIIFILIFVFFNFLRVE